MIPTDGLELDIKKVEHICHVLDEIDAVEKASRQVLREGELRELAIRLRHLLSPNNSAVVRLYGHINRKARFHTLRNSSYLAVVKDAFSSASYSVKFMNTLDKEEVQTFIKSHWRLGCVAYGSPVPGMLNESFSVDNEVSWSIDQYMRRPIAFVNGNIISRSDIIEFAANKKGLAHFDDRRKNDLEKAMDVLWELDVSTNIEGRPHRVRLLYEITQIIASEMLCASELSKLRSLLEPIRRKFGR